MSRSTFRIAAVCTGNASRSPAVERILAAALGPTVTVESAGTAAAVGWPIAAEMAALLQGRGLDSTGFAARQVTVDLLHGADLILPLATENLTPILELAPDAWERTFTLGEFASFVAGTPSADVAGRTPAERLHVLVAAAARARAAGQPTGSRAHDIPDPYRHGGAAYRVAFAMIELATGAIVRAASPAYGH